MKRQTPKEYLRGQMNHLTEDEFASFWNDFGDFCYAQAIENGYFNDGYPALILRGTLPRDGYRSGRFGPKMNYLESDGDCLNVRRETPIGQPYGPWADRYKD